MQISGERMSRQTTHVILSADGEVPADDEYDHVSRFAISNLAVWLDRYFIGNVKNGKEARSCISVLESFPAAMIGGEDRDDEVWALGPARLLLTSHISDQSYASRQVHSIP